MQDANEDLLRDSPPTSPGRISN